MCRFTNENMCEITYDLVRQAQGEKPYPMSLVGKEALWVQKAVNIGIDSHLEACFVPDRGDSYKDGARKVKGITIQTTLECKVSPESLPVLLRRLFELEVESNRDGDSPARLASDILSTIGIGEDGKLNKEEVDG
jgi:hypothetical protein